MRNLTAAMTGLLEKSGVNVWARGRVPMGNSLPCIIFSMQAAQDGWAEIDCWAGEGGECMALMDRVMTLIPRSGCKLPYPGGMAVIRAESCGMIEQKADRDAVGLRLRARMRIYEEEKEAEGC